MAELLLTALNSLYCIWLFYFSEKAKQKGMKQTVTQENSSSNQPLWIRKSKFSKGPQFSPGFLRRKTQSITSKGRVATDEFSCADLKSVHNSVYRHAHANHSLLVQGAWKCSSAWPEQIQAFPPQILWKCTSGKLYQVPFHQCSATARSPRKTAFKSPTCWTFYYSTWESLPQPA